MSPALNDDSRLAAGACESDADDHGVESDHPLRILAHRLESGQAVVVPTDAVRVAQRNICRWSCSAALGGHSMAYIDLRHVLGVE